MENLGEIIYVIGFVIFVVVAIVRKIAEGRDAATRKDETEWTAEDLPEEMRKMLFGESATQTAKPATRQPRQIDPFDETRHVPQDARREFEPKTAQPRQGTPRPPVPPQPRPQMRQAPPPPRPAERQRPPVPPRQAPKEQQPRMTPQMSEGSQPRAPQPQMRQAPQMRQQPQQQSQPQQQRRQQAPPRIRTQQVENEEGPRSPMPKRAPAQKVVRAPRVSSSWLSTKADVRRAIVLTEILGPPKALQ